MKTESLVSLVCLFACFFTVSACSSAPSVRSGDMSGVAKKSDSESLAALLADEVAFMKDSEFSISFSDGESAGVTKKVSAVCKELKVEVSNKAGHPVALDPAAYRGVLHRFRQLQEKEFNEVDAQRCREPYVLKLRVGSKTGSFRGCRGENQNSSQISKIVRDLDFMILRDSK